MAELAEWRSKAAAGILLPELFGGGWHKRSLSTIFRGNLMSASGDPWDSPRWGALRREAMLVQQLIGSGATALGRANYADKGEYYNAFFGLSTGIERLTKLILVADHAICSGGKFPSHSNIKNYGHKLHALTKNVQGISSKHQLDLNYVRPTDDISSAIIDCLDAFADANRGRYANFQSLGDPSLGEEFEPIRKYWVKVAEPIL